MDKQKLWDTLKLLLKLGVTALLLYWVFKKIDPAALKDVFLKSNPYYIFLAFVLYASSQTISAWRNLTLLKAIGLNLQYGFMLRLYMLGMFYNVSLPGGVGGDGYKIYILRKKYQLPTKRLFLAMLFDRISGLWAIAFIAVLLIILIPRIDIHASWCVAALVAGTGTYYAIMRKFFPDFARVFVATHLKAGVLQTMQAFSVVCLMLSQGFDGKFSPYLFSYFLSTIAANVPISLGGVGAREYAMTHLSPYFGMDQTFAVFIAVAFFLIGTLVSLFGLYFVYRSKEFDPMPNEKKADSEQGIVNSE